jgi:hypothetical protein
MRKAQFMSVTALIALIPIVLFAITATTEVPRNPDSEKVSKSGILIADLAQNIEDASDLERFEKALLEFSKKLGTSVNTKTDDLSSRNEIKVRLKSGGVDSYFTKEIPLDSGFSSGFVVPMDDKQTDPLSAYRMVELVLPETVYYFGSTCQTLDTVEFDGDYCQGFFLLPDTTDIPALKSANPEIQQVTTHTLDASFTSSDFREIVGKPKTAWLYTEYPDVLEESGISYTNVTVSDLNSTSLTSDNYLFDNGYTVALVPGSALNESTYYLARELYEFVTMNGTVYTGGASGKWFLKHNE